LINIWNGVVHVKRGTSRGRCYRLQVRSLGESLLPFGCKLMLPLRESRVEVGRVLVVSGRARGGVSVALSGCMSYGVGAAKAAVMSVPQSAEAAVPATIAPGPAVATPAAVVATPVPITQ
jgi:hypothetical protein